MQKKSTVPAAPAEALTDEEAEELARFAKQPHHPLARRENVARAEAALEERRRASQVDTQEAQL